MTWGIPYSEQATVKGEPEPDYWNEDRSSMGHGLGVKFIPWDESQQSVAGSGVSDTGIFELYDDMKAEFVRRVGNFIPRGSLTYGQPTSPPADIDKWFSKQECETASLGWAIKCRCEDFCRPRAREHERVKEAARKRASRSRKNPRDE